MSEINSSEEVCYGFSFFPHPSSFLGESIAIAADEAFSDSELKSFRTLECTIRNAFLEGKEFGLYSVLETLLGVYAGSFTIFDAQNSTAFVHVTPQDTLTGLARVQLSSQQKSFQTIPDATVRVTRLYGDQDKKVHRMALVIEAKRLVGLHGYSACSNQCHTPVF